MADGSDPPAIVNQRQDIGHDRVKLSCLPGLPWHLKITGPPVGWYSHRQERPQHARWARETDETSTWKLNRVRGMKTIEFQENGRKCRQIALLRRKMQLNKPAEENIRPRRVLKPYPQCLSYGYWRCFIISGTLMVYLSWHGISCPWWRYNRFLLWELSIPARVWK